MSKRTNKTKTAAEDTFVAPRKRRVKHTSFAEAVAEQAAEEGVTAEEVVEELTAEPAEADKPTRPAGTSNLANTIRAHRANYRVALHPNGKKTQNNGDPVAQFLLLVTLDELKQFSAERFEGKRYDHLNPGHARMCIGNNIRAMAKKDDPAVTAWMAAKLEQLQKAEADAA